MAKNKSTDIDQLTRELNEVRAELAKTRNEYKILLSSIDEISISLDIPSLRVLQISPACETVMGYTPQAIVSSDEGWRQYVHPDDLRIFDFDHEDLQNGVAIKKQCRIIHLDGSLKWIEAKCIPVFDDSGALIRLNGIIKDITKVKRTNKALMESEYLFRQFFDRAHEAIVVMDVESGHFTDYNHTMLELLKYSGAELLARNPISISPEYQSDGVLSAIRAEEMISRTMAGQRPVFEWMHEDAYGRPIPCEIRLSLISVNGRTLIRASLNDITERKKTEAEVLALNESLERKVRERTAELINANNQLESFSYTVSHDLQSPLRIISGYSKLLLEEYQASMDSGATEMLQIIDSNATRMGQLIRDLLSFARLGSAECSKVPTDMKPIVQEVIADLGTVHAAFTVHEMGQADCDPNLMKQVWVNLISNAVKYSSKKDKPLIEIGMDDQNGIRVYYIKDNGAGFDMRYAQKLFSVFKRLHSDAEFEGTGVGLATVHSIITRHGGRIWAEAAPDAGATFYFTLSA